MGSSQLRPRDEDEDGNTARAFWGLSPAAVVDEALGVRGMYMCGCVFVWCLRAIF